MSLITFLVKQEDIENADYNLSVSTYVESEDTREVIDICLLYTSDAADE